MKPRTESDEDFFWRHVQKSEGCWIWTGRPNGGGYGVLDVRADTPRGRRSVLAHRFSWALEHGAVPEGMAVCHHCDNPPCVRPSHLFVGTWQDNTADAFRKGRCTGPKVPRRGETSPVAVLTEPLVLELRAARRERRWSMRKIAEHFGVPEAAALQAIRGKSWKHLPGAVPAGDGWFQPKRKP